MLSRFSILYLFSAFATLLVCSVQVHAIRPYKDFNPTKTTKSLAVFYKLVDGNSYTPLYNVCTAILYDDIECKSSATLFNRDDTTEYQTFPSCWYHRKNQVSIT